MRNEEKKVAKVPRNFRLDAEINRELIEHGENFKQGDRIGDTGVIETALESYFERHPAPKSNSKISAAADKIENELGRKFRRKRRNEE